MPTLSDPIIDFLISGVAGLGVWSMLAVLLVFTQLTLFAVTLYLNGSQAHRGVDFHPVVAHFWVAGAVNRPGHWWGYRTFESGDTSANLTPWALWIGGEELHNNHHAFPSSARFLMRRWELDIGWVAIRGLQALGLAKLLRAVPSLDIRPNIAVPDADTLKALLSHRFQAMTDCQRNVFKPALREDAAATCAKLRQLLPRRLRKGLVDDGRWLTPDAREQLQRWVVERPRMRTLVAYRARSAAVLEARSHDASERLKHLQQWCHEAGASGNAALQAYAARLTGYALSGS
ncbi:hypothetical protein ACFQS6_07005 [Xanthomonas populi]|uniref:Acyl-CoA desaturase n=1 Tax=Xanthomonas populi TaxID=53414 RepID=A0A2S7F493_9XANT|nr:hypothetical protein [Xanthomonas populi]PPV00224.1 hypothetical protein XpopCFBP1817_01255 [Xanthomonas populi]